jgi:CRISPR-associated endonuclease/helicase Cas3
MNGADVDRAVERVWAKSRVDDQGVLSDWLPLTAHLADSAAVAGLLWDHWVSPAIRSLVGSRVGGADVARQLIALLAGVHDIGKATPVFQSKVPRLAVDLEQLGLPLGITVTSDDKRRLPHGLAGQVLLGRYLVGRGWTQALADQLGAVVGGHHGVPASDSDLEAASHRPDLLGDARWGRVQVQLLDEAVARAGIDLDALRGRAIGQPAAAVLTGLVIVADWIASNSDLFPLAPIGRLPDLDPRRADRGWQRVSLPSPWLAVDEERDADQLVAARFGIDGPGLGARPVQRVALESARTCDVPGILVIEAPMGEGKTEAAMLAVEVLAARSGASGCFIALPTQATSNAMFSRVVDWLAHVPDGALADETSHRHAVVLAHGKASLDPTFRTLRMDGRASQVGADTPLADSRGREQRDPRAIDAYVHWWMTNRKKSPLAEFAVGTIDQLLFLALQARHVVLRHLGMAGKVVVIDEVHSYDAYMGVYLARVLEWLGAYGVPVVMLSATLPPAVRDRLVAAYRSGTHAQEASVTTWQRPAWGTPLGLPAPADPQSEVEIVYPAVTTLTDGHVRTVAVPASTRRSHVQIELRDDGLESLAGLLGDALVTGGCALVVRNTVARAQQTYEHLVARFGADNVGLSHSRFLACDRSLNDRRLVEQFGPPLEDGHDGHRPPWYIVVATQVVEQSLDVDFDLLVTDAAPIDLVLQRIGRVHRHVRARPTLLARPRCVVIADEWAAVPPVFDHGSAAVYEPYALLQTAALLQARAADGGVITLPDDIAPLVHAAYGEHPDVPMSWVQAVADARQRQETGRASQESRATAFRLAPPREGVVSLNGWLGRSVGEADESAGGYAQVRDSDDSVEVLLLARSADHMTRIPVWVGAEVDLGAHAGEVVPESSEPSPDLARAIASCAVRLPAVTTRGARGDALIEEITKRWYPESWQKVPELRGQLVLVLDEQPDGGLAGIVHGTRFEYHPRTGLRVTAEAPGGEHA